MLAHAKKVLAPPVFPDDEGRTRAAYVLNGLLWSLIPLLPLLAIAAAGLSVAREHSLTGILLSVAIALGVHFLLRSGRVRAASWLFWGASWILATVYLVFGGGTSAAGVSFYLVCTVYGGLLLGTQAAVVLSLLSILAGLVIALVEDTVGLPAPIFPRPSVAGWLDITIGLCLVVLAIGTTLDSLHGALAAASRELSERRKAEQELKHRTAEMEALRQAAQVMGSSLDVNEILRLILEQLKRVLVYDTASVAIFRQDHTPDLVVGLGYADEVATSRAAGKLLQSSPILSRMARDLQPVVSPDVRHLEGWIWVPGAEHVRSWICIPLVARDSMIGALMVDHSQPDFYGPAELRLTHALAQHAAQAIQNAHLYDETLRRNRELALLNRVIAASAGQDPESVMEIACQELAFAFDLAGATAILFDKDKTQALVVAECRREPGSTLLGRMVTLDLAPPDPADRQAALTQPGGARGDPHLELVRGLFSTPNSTQPLLLPLGDDEDVMGGLALVTAEGRTLTGDQVNLAQRVADQVGGVLARAWLEDEARELEDQFRHIQKMDALGRLAGGIAHDFNNLISVIQLSSAMLERGLHAQDPLRQHTQHIRETCGRSTRLVKQLLSFSQRDTVEVSVLQLGDVVHDLGPTLRRILGDRIALVLSVGADLWPVRADRSQIEQVVINLIINARDAIPEPGDAIPERGDAIPEPGDAIPEPGDTTPKWGTVTLELENVVIDQAYAAVHLDARPGDHVRLGVTDSGVGISKEAQPHIFEPFFTTKADKGTGLGLSMVFGIVTQGGGHITVQSEVGQGTTFLIHFPRATEGI